MRASNGISSGFQPRRQAKLEASYSSEEDYVVFTKRCKRLIQETRAASLWSCCSIMFRLSISLLINTPSFKLYGDLFTAGHSTRTKQSCHVALSLLAKWILYLLPSKVISKRCPGFFFSNSVILLWVNDKTGIIPNFSVRCCEYMIGRISLGNLLAIAPVHLITFYSTAFFVQKVFPPRLATIALETIEYNDRDSPWILVLVTVAFSVGMLVLPVLLRLNKIPRWTMVFVSYPLYQLAVDQSGVGESFSPIVLLPLSSLGHQPIQASWRFLGTVIGGLVGGLIMNTYFPDGDDVVRVKAE